MSELSWGRRYVMVRPDHFRIDYAINPYMDPADQPDPRRARAQWVDLLSTIERLGAHRRGRAAAARRPRHGLRDEPRPRSSPTARRPARHVVLSHMRYAERRMETPTAQPWFARQRPRHVVRRARRRRRPPRGRRRVRLGRRARGGLRPAHRGAGAQAPGHRPRRPGARRADHPPRRCTTSTSPSARSTNAARWSCPAAFDDASAAALLELVPEPLVLTDEEALTRSAPTRS